jgi:hypothetical protein
MSSTTIMAGYGPLDQADEVGIEEALVLEECAAQEYRAASADVFRSFARRPGGLNLDAHDLAGITPVFGDLSAVD